jgi:hypothetical protein
VNKKSGSDVRKSTCRPALPGPMASRRKRSARRRRRGFCHITRRRGFCQISTKQSLGALQGQRNGMQTSLYRLFLL